MDEHVRQALNTERSTVDITTTGKGSGQPRRIETWLHRIDDHFYLTGTPGKRDWLANLAAHPHFTVHLKENAQADLSATARPITDDAERRDVLTTITDRVGHRDNLDEWLKRSPLVAVDFEGLGAT